MKIAVLTPSLPERREMLTECMDSIAAQTLQPLAHVVAIDYERVGPAQMLNRLIGCADAIGAEWVALLADDDLAYPGHLETLAGAATDADIIYSWCDVTGRGGWNPNRLFDADALRMGNYIPGNALIRTRLAHELGWRTDAAHGFEDWDFWLRAIRRGARFACVPERTWCYRFHGTNISWIGA